MFHWLACRYHILLLPVIWGIYPAPLPGARQYLENRTYLDVPERHRLIQATEHRATLDLCGLWQASNNGAPASEIWVPGCTPDAGEYNFRRTFRLDSTFTGKHLRLVAEGIHYRATIRLNDRVIGSHTGGYTRISMMIPAEVIRWDADNVLDVQVDTRLSVRHSIPLRQRIWGWRNYGGILREIYILGVPIVSVEDIASTTTYDSAYTTARMQVALRFQNHQVLETSRAAAGAVENIVEIGYLLQLIHQADGSTAATLDRRDAAVRIHHSSTETAELTIPAPRLWSPSTPQLYTLQVTVFRNGVPIDQRAVTVGFRDVALSGGDIFLNGNRLQLNALLYHEDAPNIGAAMNWQTLESDIQKIKTLGINTIQTGLYPCHPYLYDLCDRYGLIVLESLPVWNVPGSLLTAADFQALARQIAQDMIDRDRHHPSILAWGIGTDLPVDMSGAGSYIQSLAEHVKSLDHRLVYLTGTGMDGNVSLNGVDILGPVWLSSSPEETGAQLSQFLSRHADRPVILGRFGADLFPENFDSGYSDLTSLEHQGKYIRDMFAVMRNLKALDGSIFWSYADWMGERPVLTNTPSTDAYLYAMGLLDYERRERVGYTIMQSLLTNQELPNLYMGAPPGDDPQQFRIAGIAAILLLVAGMRWRRRFGANLKRSLVFTRGFFDDVAHRRTVPRGQTPYLAFLIAVVLSTLGAAILHHYRRNHLFDMLLDHLLPAMTFKEWLTYLAWEPPVAIGAGIGAALLGLVLVAVLLMSVGMLNRKPVPFLFAWQAAVWSGTMLLLLLPLAMGVYSLLAYPYMLMLTLALLALSALWYLSRVVQALAVYTRSEAAAHRVALCVLILAGGSVVAVYMQWQHGLWQYLTYFAHMAGQ